MRRAGLVLLIILGATIVLAAALPFLVYPRVVTAVPSPDGRHVAEIVVSPARKGMAYLTLLSGHGVDVSARVRRRSDSVVVFEKVLTGDEDMESDAEEAEIAWESAVRVRFRDRRGARAEYHVSSDLPAKGR